MGGRKTNRLPFYKSGVLYSANRMKSHAIVQLVTINDDVVCVRACRMPFEAFRIQNSEFFRRYIRYDELCRYHSATIRTPVAS